jgi:protease-4
VFRQLSHQFGQSVLIRLEQADARLCRLASPRYTDGGSSHGQAQIYILFAARCFVLVSTVGSACCMPWLAAPPCAWNATLVPKVGGTLAEVAPTMSSVSFAASVTHRPLDHRQPAQGEGGSAHSCRIRRLIRLPFWARSRRSGRRRGLRNQGSCLRLCENGGDREYLATAADKVIDVGLSRPDGRRHLRGVPARHAGRGAYPDLHHIGDYRSYSNTCTEKGFTRAHKEMDESLNRDLYEQIVTAIASGRKKTDAEVRALIDQGPFLPEDALKAGLVDDVQYEDQVDAKPTSRARRAMWTATTTRASAGRRWA